MLAGYEMDEFKRADDWWDNGENLYLDNIQGQGFERVESPQLGDVILIQISADVPNHAAISIWAIKWYCIISSKPFIETRSL